MGNCYVCKKGTVTLSQWYCEVIEGVIPKEWIPVECDSCEPREKEKLLEQDKD